MIIDIILLVAAFMVILGLAWLSEQVKDWMWDHVFALARFLFKTILRGLVVLFVLGAVGGYLWFHPFPRSSPGWFQWVILFAVLSALGGLLWSGWRRISRLNDDGELEPQVEPVPVADSHHEVEDDPNAFSGKRCLLVTFGFSFSATVLVMWYVHNTWGVATEQAVGMNDYQYMASTFISLVVTSFLGFLLWTGLEIWMERRHSRLQAEAEQREEEVRVEEARLRRLEEAEREAEAERVAAAERAEAARADLDPPTDPRVTRWPFNPAPFPGPASGGTVRSPVPGSRPMPPPTFGRPTARPAEERDMDDMEHTPHPRAGARREDPAEDTGDERSRERLPRPQEQPRRWPWVAGGLILISVLVAAVWFWPKGEPSEQELLVERAAKLQAEDTLQSVMKTDPVLSKVCPQGWNDDCWRELHTRKIDLPPCITVVAMYADVGWWDDLWNNHGAPTYSAPVTMDDRCRAEMIRLNGQRVKEAAAQPSGKVEKYLSGTEFSQRRAFEAGDTAKIDLLLSDPALKREVILDFWRSDNVPWRILAHPSLTQGDLNLIYGEMQAKGQYEGMEYLVINSNLDPNLRGMWIMRPPDSKSEADKTERERRILLGLHQPHVPTGAVSSLMDEAVEEGEAGDLSLWKVLLKAGQNGDLPAHRCRLSTDTAAATDKDRKSWPVCVKGETWDFISEMKWYAEQTDMPFSSVSAGTDWDALKYACQWEFMAGRHSGVARSPAPAVPTLADASPSNLPPKPE